MNPSKTSLKTESFLGHASGVHLNVSLSSKLTRSPRICTSESKEPQHEILDRNAAKHFAITFSMLRHVTLNVADLNIMKEN